MNESSTPVTKGLTLVGNVNPNINKFLFVLKTGKSYTFTNENEMENYVKTKFPDSTTVHKFTVHRKRLQS